MAGTVWLILISAALEEVEAGSRGESGERGGIPPTVEEVMDSDIDAGTESRRGGALVTGVVREMPSWFAA